MRHYILLPLLTFTHAVFGFSYKSKDCVTISYKISHKNICFPEKNILATIQGLSVQECVKACGLRIHCHGIAFKRRPVVCELFLSAEYSDMEVGDCIIVNRSDINVHMNPCGDCTNGSVCDTSLEICTYQECPSVGLPVTVRKIDGNMNEVNAKLKFTCVNGYQNENGNDDVVCLENGNWSAIVGCVKDCDNPPLITNGYLNRDDNETASLICDNCYDSTIASVNCKDQSLWGNISCTRIACGTLPSVTRGRVVPETVNGYFYMDTATVVCDDWFLSSSISITCTSTGTWEIPTDCIDCYPAASQEYMGKTNITINGRTCQRWDSQEPHPHTLTNLQYYPESKLSDAHNYCRTPEAGDYDPWCMTMDPGTEWEYCNVNKCPWT